MALGINLMRFSLASVITFAVLSGAAIAEPLDFRKIKLADSWVHYGFGTRVPAVAVNSEDIVHMRGAVRQSVADVDNRVFILPKAYRPNRYVYLRVSLLQAKAGLLTIRPNGEVAILTMEGFVAAAAFLSLEGISYSRN